MTLLAYVWVGDAIVCIVDNKTSATGPSGDQESLDTTKSVTYPLDVADHADKSARAVLMVSGRNVFTPEANGVPTGETSATQLTSSPVPSLTSDRRSPDIGDLGGAVWPAPGHECTTATVAAKHGSTRMTTRKPTICPRIPRSRNEKPNAAASTH